MKKILVSGGAGFIGSSIVKNLIEDGEEVIVIDNLLNGNKLDGEVLDSITFVKGDVRNFETVKKYSKGCNVIYHFAAVLGVDIVADNPVETMQTEVIGMKNVVDAAIFHGIDKIIYASTSGVYGHSAIERSVSENFQLDPRTSYSISKRYNEIYLAAVYEEKGLESVSLRYFNVYGPKQDNRMVIPRFFEQALSGNPITIYGSGEQTRDFTYIDDAVEVTIKLANKVSGCEIFNVSNEKEISVLKLAKIIKSIANSKSPIIFLESPKKRYDFEVERRIGSSEKLFEAIQFKPSTSLQSGLSEIYETYI
ncbi:MAG: NAD-dependent epimerase/dehydratase family protein [Candidatus Cloacimonetes bacterium]|nr:NAD-dependent epimerase/dehydratase family protein [Candidatus Cloacimonadota bacterium]